jgi:hypothetical protein
VPLLRLELKTFDLADRHSIQLSYRGTKKGEAWCLATHSNPASIVGFVQVNSTEFRSAVLIIDLTFPKVKGIFQSIFEFLNLLTMKTFTAFSGESTGPSCRTAINFLFPDSSTE